eukprot:4806939-Pyramimonas_sp.AAC.1
MLDHYRGILATAETAKEQKFVVAQYKELHETSQGVEGTDHGKMMWEDEAIEFWQTTPGGSLGKTEAKAKWDDLSAHYKERKIPHDWDGPSASKPMRLRIKTGDTLDFKNSAMQKQLTERVAAAIKKPREEDWARMRGKIYRNFEKMGSGAASTDMQDVAIGIAAAGSGQAFSEVGMQFPDVTILGRQGQEKEAEELDDLTEQEVAGEGKEAGKRQSEG